MNMMETQGTMDINEVKLRGFIVGKYIPKPGLIILTVCVPSSKSNMPNYPKVVFFGKDVEMADSFNTYAHVEIDATIQTQRKITETKKIYTQSIVGKTIKETERTMSVAFNSDIGGSYLQPENSFKLKGTVRKRVLVTDNVLEITVETYINGRHSFVKMYKYGTKVKLMLEALAEGTQVFVLGEVQTLKKEKDGQTSYFENMVIKEIKAV